MNSAEMTKALKYLESVFDAKEKDDMRCRGEKTWISSFKGLKSYLRDKQATPQDILFVEGLYSDMSRLYDEARDDNKIASVKIEKKGTRVQAFVQKYSSLA